MSRLHYVHRGLSVGASVQAVALVLLVLSAGMARGQECGGDCNEDGVVDISEVVTSTNVALGLDNVAACPAVDTNDSGEAEINEVVGAVGNLIDGCPTETPTTTPTPIDGTPTDTPTATPTGPAASCELADTSTVTLVLALPFPSFAATGGINVQCDELDPGTGRASCTCDIDRFDPLAIPGVGFVCISPAPGCPTGSIDCSGSNGGGAGVGSGIGIDLVTQRAIGLCDGNEDCDTQCEAYCAADGKVPTSAGFGCEGFCEGGDRDGEPCTCDTAGTGTGICANPESLDCPGGSCNGPDGAGLGNVCECQCIDAAAGDAPPPGGLQCNLGSSLIVEMPAGVACDGQGILITVGTRCIPMTTGQATSVLIEANPSGSCAATRVCVGGPNVGNSCTETPECSPMCAGGVNQGMTCAVPADCPGSFCTGTCQPVFCVTDEQCGDGDVCDVTATNLGPVQSTGVPAECAALGSGSFSGTQLRGVVNFFGSTVGDIVTQVNADCL